ncbi:hypothetical protein [Oribacterium sp. NK2B42]|uniref:hypothetical protein n=1 Tax=Oribacterium sp. NK2B42 TaxID=689781 RepID=UPI0004216E04|nr:hypothetical protein [Oribacterium sp. NK2B42]
MKRRSLCGKRVLAVILAAALCMNSTVTVLAEPDNQTENNLDSSKIEVKSGETAHEEKIEKDSASCTDGTSAVDVSMDNGDEVTVEIKGDVTVSGGSEEQASEPNYKVLNVGYVLRIVDTLTAINNFTAANAGIRGT